MAGAAPDRGGGGLARKENRGGQEASESLLLSRDLSPMLSSGFRIWKTMGLSRKKLVEASLRLVVSIAKHTSGGDAVS